MSNPIDPRPVRLSPRLNHLVREYATQKGITINQAINHVLAKGFHQINAEEGFHVSDFTENFFEKE